MKNSLSGSYGKVFEDTGNSFLNVQPAEIGFAKPNGLTLDPPINKGEDCHGSDSICVPVKECKNGFIQSNYGVNPPKIKVR